MYLFKLYDVLVFFNLFLMFIQNLYMHSNFEEKIVCCYGNGPFFFFFARLGPYVRWVWGSKFYMKSYMLNTKYTKFHAVSMNSTRVPIFHIYPPLLVWKIFYDLLHLLDLNTFLKHLLYQSFVWLYTKCDFFQEWVEPL